MKKEYAIYPFEYIRIKQRHDEGNHTGHWKGSKNYIDKPWDEGCKDSGRSYFVPQNDFIVEEILGLKGEVTNSVRLKSVNKLYIPIKKESDYLYITLTHMNEDTIKSLKVGQIIEKGSKVIMEGKDGATANHFHCTANIGKYYGVFGNSNGKMCFTYEKSLLPDEAFYIDTKFNQILNSKKYNFKEIPKTIENTPNFEQNGSSNINTLPEQENEKNTEKNTENKGILKQIKLLIIKIIEKIFKVS